MTTPATIQKRQELMNFIEQELAPEPAVQAVVGIGSIASGLARAAGGRMTRRHGDTETR